MTEKNQNKKKKKKSDLNVLAHKIVEEATKDKSNKKDSDKKQDSEKTDSKKFQQEPMDLRMNKAKKQIQHRKILN